VFPAGTPVLIVDDAASMRAAVAIALKSFGLGEVIEASNGEQAWKLLAGDPSRFGLIISDQHMPECTGIELLRRVRADRRFDPVAFILVTAEAEKDAMLAAVRSGVSNYLVKPFTQDDLRDKLTVTAKRFALKRNLPE